MTKEELATLLNGREYGDEITAKEEKLAEQDGLVVVYGASDDLMEFAGAIHDEIGCYEGGIAYLTDTGLLQNACDNDDCPYFKHEQSLSNTIEAVWGVDGYSWTYITSIPHCKFTIFDEAQPYCEGIVFNLKDV